MTNWSVLVIVLNRCTLTFLTVWYCFQHHSKHWIQTCFKYQETEKFISAALSRATGGFQTRYLVTVLNPSVSWDFSKLQTAVWVYTCSCTTNKNPIRLIWTLKRNAFRQKRPLGELKRVDYRPCFLFRFQHFCTSWPPTFFKRWSRGIYSFLSSIWRIWNKWFQRPARRYSSLVLRALNLNVNNFWEITKALCVEYEFCQGIQSTLWYHISLPTCS